MATIAERIGALEVRVNGLETWAGPGQAGVLAAGLQSVRGDLTILRRAQEGMLRDLTKLRSTQDGMVGDIAALRSDVETLKADMSDVKETLREVLRRLPPPALAS